MKRSLKILVGVLALAAVFAGACQLSAPTGVDEGQIATQSQMIIEAGRSTQTAVAFETEVAAFNLTAGAPTLTFTQVPTDTPTNTVTPVPPTETPLPPTPTPIPTNTPIPSFTPVPPTATQTPIPCDRASFVDDVNIPDGTVISPSSTFTKTWRLRNTGSCTWTTSYGIVYVGGDRMNASYRIALTRDVPPDSTVDVSVTFSAPSSEGTYKSDWKLENASGVQFGTGARGVPFYVEIQVKPPASGYNLDFAGSYCSAEWSSGAGPLVCPGSSGESKGYVQRIDKPTLETGYIDDEPVLLTVPQAQTDGVIRGKFPAYTVQSGDRFQAVLGCARNADDCSVKFELAYVIDGESTIQTAGSWTKSHNNTLLPVDLDLNFLAGKKVRFILTVFANGPMNEDLAQWLAPRIDKP